MRRGMINDRVLLYVCLLLASSAGVFIVGVSLYKSYSNQEAVRKEEEQNKNWLENLVPSTGELTDALLRDVTAQRSLAVFKNGTVVIIAEPCENPVDEAVTLLEKAGQSPAFAVNKVDDDFAVRYSGPVFTRISGKAIDQELKWLKKNWESFLDPIEVEAADKKPDEPDLASKVGLMARSLMRRDLKEKKVVKILKARPGSTKN